MESFFGWALFILMACFVVKGWANIANAGKAVLKDRPEIKDAAVNQIIRWLTKR
jgi:hypothetical protein